MRFLIIDGERMARVEALTKAEAVTRYATRHLPQDSRSKLFDVRVLDLGAATKFSCLVTRGQDSVQAISKEVR